MKSQWEQLGSNLLYKQKLIKRKRYLNNYGKNTMKIKFYFGQQKHQILLANYAHKPFY